MDEKDITLKYLNETYKYYANIFNKTKDVWLQVILAEKLDVLEKTIAIIKTMEG